MLGDPDTAKAYIDVCLKAVNEYMKKSVKSPRNIVLAAHSGGGHILGNMAGFNGIFTKQVEEIWCFDCTYWGNVVDWASKSHATRKLFVYSTGEGPDTDRPNPKFDSTQPEGPKNQKYLPSGTGYTASDIMQLRKSSATTIEVLIEAYNGNLVNEQMTPHFKETYGIPDGKRHYESIEKYLGKLVDMSDNLQ